MKRFLGTIFSTILSAPTLLLAQGTPTPAVPPVASAPAATAAAAATPAAPAATEQGGMVFKDLLEKAAGPFMS